MNKKLIPAILGSLGILGISSQTLAAPVFTVNPNSIPGTTIYNQFNADAIFGGTSGRIIMDGDTKTATEKGYVQFSSFSKNSNGIDSDITGLGLTGSPNTQKYGLYLTFDLAVSYDTNSANPFGAGTSNYIVDSLTFTLWADPGLDTTFIQASLTTDASVSGATGDDYALATGSLVRGSAAINEDGGVGINTTTTFVLTDPEGKAFFIDPDPFYQFMFSGANNTGPGVLRPDGYDLDVGCTTGTCNFAIVNSTLTIDYAGVPEPATLALFGISLLGFGASRLRKPA